MRKRYAKQARIIFKKKRGGQIVLMAAHGKEVAKRPVPLVWRQMVTPLLVRQVRTRL